MNFSFLCFRESATRPTMVESPYHITTEKLKSKNNATIPQNLSRTAIIENEKEKENETDLIYLIEGSITCGPRNILNFLFELRSCFE